MNLLSQCEYLDGNMSEIWKLSDDVVYLKTKKNVTITFEAQEEQLALLLELTKSDKIYVIANGQNLKYVDRDARDWAKSERAIYHSAAVALVVPNPISRMIGNMYLGFNAPPHPVNLFDKFEPAYEWILKIKETMK